MTTPDGRSAEPAVPPPAPGASQVPDDAPPATLTSKQESVATKIRDLIIDGELAPGLHLMEVPLAERLGVSRTPVREALSLLAQEGLLEPGPKRGFKVRTFTLDDILQAYDVRGALEGLACRLLAERGVDQRLADQLQECLHVGDRLLTNGAFDEAHHGPWLEMNNQFHSLLTLGSGNAMLANFVMQSQRVPLASARHVHWYRLDTENFDLARRAHEDHHRVVQAILNRQSHRAQTWMEEHIFFSRELVARRFQEQPGGIGFNSANPL
ncbi:MAG: GntR family transcriptional regulator [Paucimonas sp.]|nr:GntR family transcriptional regulator [Paucimonas sp.]